MTSGVISPREMRGGLDNTGWVTSALFLDILLCAGRVVTTSESEESESEELDEDEEGEGVGVGIEEREEDWFSVSRDGSGMGAVLLDVSSCCSVVFSSGWGGAASPGGGAVRVLLRRRRLASVAAWTRVRWLAVGGGNSRPGQIAKKKWKTRR